MKLKGVNPFEQHVEKIVLGVAGAIFLIALSAQFLLQPNMVKVGNAQAVPPARAFHEARNEAQLLRERMRAESHIDLPPIPSLNLSEQFLARRNAPVSQAQRIVALGPSLQIERVAGPAAPMGAEEYADLAVPPPTAVIAYSPRGTIDPFEARAAPALALLLPEQQPYDKAGVSVEARFNGQELRTQLLGGEPGTGASFPAAWWRETVEILTVRLDREELTETGEWSNLVEGVTPIPGRYTVMDQVRQVNHTNGLLELVDEARDRAEDIRRPSYLRMIAGTPWLPPSQAVALRPQVRDPFIDKALRDREVLQRQAEETQQEIDSLEGDAGGAGGRAPGGARAPGGGGGGDPARDLARRKQELERRLRGIQARIAAIDADLARRGFTPPPTQPAEMAAPDRVIRPLLEDASVQVWAHDLTAEPGKIYRYRIAVGINNPAFGRAQALVEAQQDLAARPVTYSQPSEWSAPVQVLDDKYFFIQNAHMADSLGGTRTPARARAEVYQFFYGYYRRGEVQLEPGDLITTQVKLPDPELLLIFENAPAQPGNEDPVERPATPEGKPWTEPIIATIDCYLLDVAGVPGAVAPGAQIRTAAYLRGEDGGIIQRHPDQDRQSEVYRWVAQSAQEGERQGAPVAEPTPVREPDREPGPRREPRDPPSPSPPGGGMGGG